MKFEFTWLSTQNFTFVIDVLSTNCAMVLEILMSFNYELMNLLDALIIVILVKWCVVIIAAGVVKGRAC